MKPDDENSELIYRQRFKRWIFCYATILIVMIAGMLTRHWYLEQHDDEFEGREDPNDIKIRSFEWKYTEIRELWQHQWFWGFLMAISYGLLVYGTERDENYFKDVIIRLAIAFALYYGMYVSYITNRDHDD